MMPNQKRSHRSRSSSRHHSLWPNESPPKRPKSPNLPPSPEEKSLDSIPNTLQQMQTEIKTSKRISMIEFRFEHHSRTFMPSQVPPDDQISVLTYSDGELLDYSEDDVSLTTEPQEH